MSDVLGRTNRTFPRIWLALRPAETGREADHKALLEHALAQGVPLDVSSSLALWGGLLAGRSATLVARGGLEVANATSSDHACDLLSAHLIETLSSLTRPTLDIFFFRFRRALEEYQIDGALQALEAARQDGLIKHVGLLAEGNPLAALGFWQFRDAFELVLVPRNPVETELYEALAPLANQRRAGLVTYRPLNWGGGIPFHLLGEDGHQFVQSTIAHYAQTHPVLVGVRSINDIDTALDAPNHPIPPDFESALTRLESAYRDDSAWRALQNADERNWVREAVERRFRNG